MQACTDFNTMLKPTLAIRAVLIAILATSSMSAQDKDWWKRTIVYQIYPRSYQDSNGDGTGDLKGIESRLDYIKNLGVRTVWLSPIYKSPMKDFGYDIEDFREISPVFGTMEDFRSLSKAMKEKGIKLVLDFVPNHSSNLHEWFQRSVKKEAPYSDYYIWVDAKGFESDGKPVPPNNWRSVFGGSAWEWNDERKQYYFHQYLKEQPDLNYRNPLVLEEMKDVLQFWLDQGVDGFRVDAAARLFEDEQLRDEPLADEPTINEYHQLKHIYTYNLPEVLNVLREFRILLDKNSENGTKPEHEGRYRYQYHKTGLSSSKWICGSPITDTCEATCQLPGHATSKKSSRRIMMVEAYLPTDKVMDYYGNKSIPIAHFPFNFGFISRIKRNITAQKAYNVIKTWTDHLPEGAWSNWVVGNHDSPRVATRFGCELVDAINMIILLLPGTPVTYYGEEIGMEDTEVSWEETEDTKGINAGPTNYKLFSRDPERTPMQWNAQKNAGFSTANQTWLPVNKNYVTLNVKAQLKAKWSHLKVYKLLSEARKSEAVMNGALDIQVLEDNVLVYTRVKEGHPGYMVVVNFSNSTVTADLTKMNHVPDLSTVYMFSTTYADHFNTKARIHNTAVELPGKGGIVLTFVPEFQDTKEPIPL